jgi:hypothetical protein
MMKRYMLALAGLLLAASAGAQVAVQDAWVRATVTSQTATGAFMRLAAQSDMKLVAARSPMAGIAEIHEMMMHGEMMHMHAIPGVDLPAGKDVALQPGGGYHVMLLDLKQQVHAGSKVPLTLVFEGADGRRESVEIEATARVLAAKSD